MSPALFDWLQPWIRTGRATRLVQAYRRAFLGRPSVLADLAALCHANAETYVPGDAQASAFNEGRRAVWLHITRMLDLHAEDMRQLKEAMNHDQPRPDDRDGGINTERFADGLGDGAERILP